MHSCQIYKRGNGEEKRVKKGALKKKKKKGQRVKNRIFRRAIYFSSFHISNAENITNIEGRAQGFSR